ncbi:hypothetical protein [Arthrobacter cavernae]|uniref:DNA methylase adenine-specific domain-containing protein n=1 Tax=Arthrobacter cavernae TaxID=2817681 RepID=A0A939HGB0_9MICC|nr:hypothetical protein [Arthrobacter cavernae]MBO1268699.1 hypothetical protein [Arthrobacter cavernae]
MNSSAVQLRMTLSDVAALAKVQRPVVSMWRTRSAHGPAPFPQALAVERGLEVFDADEVAAWLEATGRGNNAEASGDAAAFAVRAGVGRDNRNVFDAVTALLALRAVTGTPLTGRDRDSLLDAADESDPDDAFLYSEIEALADGLESTAEYAERLIDSAYSVPAAFETLLADRFRSGIREHADTALTEAATHLVASAALALALSLESEPVFVDPTPGGSDLLLGIVRAAGDGLPITALTPDGDDASARLVRRRLAAHGIDSQLLKMQAGGTFDVHGPAVHLAQYPSPGEPGMDAGGILAAIESIVMQMDDSQRAVIIAPASTLCDGALTASAGAHRSELLRSGRVRAIVRLPQGLLRRKPREAQCLWVLGPSFAEVDIADRWTMVADLTAARLTPDVVHDLVSDVVASMGSGATVRAHSFRFARLVPTRHLLASRGSLVELPSRGGAGEAAAGAEAALRIEELQELLMKYDGSVPAAVSVLAQSGGRLAPATVQELLSAGTLRYIKGNRLDPADLSARERTRVIGTAELLDEEATKPRSISILDFAAKYPSGRLTEPGDVVFCTSPRPAAMVDAEGGAVVVFPARVLRIDAGDPGGLVPAVLAADINSLPPQDKAWRQWRLRRTPYRQRRPLEVALAELQHEQDLTRQRLQQLDELATLILDGVAGGSLTLTDPTSTATTEGTR